jgi:hypothetical protein
MVETVSFFYSLEAFQRSCDNFSLNIQGRSQKMQEQMVETASLFYDLEAFQTTSDHIFSQSSPELSKAVGTNGGNGLSFLCTPIPVVFSWNKMLTNLVTYSLRENTPRCQEKSKLLLGRFGP